MAPRSGFGIPQFTDVLDFGSPEDNRSVLWLRPPFLLVYPISDINTDRRHVNSSRSFDVDVFISHAFRPMLRQNSRLGTFTLKVSFTPLEFYPGSNFHHILRINDMMLFDWWIVDSHQCRRHQLRMLSALCVHRSQIATVRLGWLK